ncbi:hypothetical protein IV203_010150 [Nitzschia inconspicua]|uniref:Uncharacterized protein n=1 Tax=Nitzschia inconspicua TaxID=303405 RepID=A0A9K3KX49_9STRA|nr:hypothetical protein IV203_010150 [Nitzschia inconspicua]
MYGSRRSTRTARNPQSGRGGSGNNNHGTSAVTPGTRSTRGVRKSRGSRQTASGAAGSCAAAESGGTTTKGPVRKFALVRRRPAPHIAMWVEKWVPVTELTEEEREQYDKENLPKEMVPMIKPELLVLADETAVTTTTTSTSNAAIPMIKEEQQPAEALQQTITEMSVQPMDIAHDTALSQGENPTISHAIMEEETQQLSSCRTVQTNSEGNDSTAVTEAPACTDSKTVAIAELSSAGMEPIVAAVTTATTTTATTTIATEAATPVATGLTPDATETISKPESDTHALMEETTNENPVVATNEAATAGTYDDELPPPQQDITPMSTPTTTTTTTEIPVTTDGMLLPAETSSTADTAAREESVKVSMEHPAPTSDEDLPAAKKPRLL